MAFGRLERGPRPVPMSDINMTPLIDVMLVLLVIFMITAPLMTSSLRLDLPRVDGAPATADEAVIEMSIDAHGQLYLADQPVDLAGLTQRLAGGLGGGPRTEVQLRADQRVPYGRVAEVIARLQKAGLSRIGFVTMPSDSPAP